MTLRKALKRWQKYWCGDVPRIVVDGPEDDKPGGGVWPTEIRHVACTILEAAAAGKLEQVLSEKGESESHLILDARGVVGNCASFWRPEGQGYTCDFDDAGRYTLEEASSHRETDVPVPLTVAKRLIIRHVRLDQLRQNGVKLP